MASHHLNRLARDLAIEQTLDAAIELDEVIQGGRAESPALVALASTLYGHVGARPAARELLGNSQTTSLYHRAATFAGKEKPTAVDLDKVATLLIAIGTSDLAKYSFFDLQLGLVLN